MSTLSALLRPVFAALKLLLIGAIAIGALVFGTMVAFAIFIGVSLVRLLRGRGEATASTASTACSTPNTKWCAVPAAAC